jgi:hypothetical protein
LLLASIATGASADDGDSISAESRFRHGKEWLAQKDYARACPALADSFRLDPATGSLLALALCHERQGKLATAFHEYNDAAVRAKAESRPDREKAARDKVRTLESQISLLTIALAPEARDIDGLEVKRNGVVIESSLFGKPIPVDGGRQLIEASAPGMIAWRTTLAIAATQDMQTITVPGLEEKDSEPEPAPAPRPAPQAPPKKAEPPPKPKVVIPTVALSSAERPAAERPSSGRDGLRGAGVATAAAGVVGLGIGTGFLLRAIAKNRDSKTGCNGNVCSIQGTQDRWEAQDAGNVATIGFIAGGVLTAGGVMMYYLGRPRRTLSACAGHTCVEAAPSPMEHGFGGVVQGSFW